jgi:hypothetical protein
LTHIIGAINFITGKEKIYAANRYPFYQGILFIIRKYRKHLDGTSPINVRITISDRSLEMSCKHTILPERWNQATQKADG